MERNNSTQPVQDISRKRRKRESLYLCLQIKGEHGEAEVEHEVLGLEALQGSPHPECHHGLALDEDEGTDDIEGAHQQDQHKTGLRGHNTTGWHQAGTWHPAGTTQEQQNLHRGWL